VVLLQSGDEQTLARWRTFVGASLRYFSTLYRRLGVLLTEDDVRGESFYNAMLPGIADELERQGVARIDAGALCVFFDEFKGKDGALVPLIVRKSDGGFGYAATDLAAIRFRTRELSATRLLYVTGAPQQQHFAMVFATAKKAGFLPAPARAEHVMFGSILGPDKKMFKTRSGENVKLADLLDEAVARAEKAVREKNPELDPGEVTRVAQAVGIGALKYADLSSDRIKDYVFDWDRMLAFEGNTGPYLQYAHARICSIARKAADAGIVVDASTRLVLATEPERKLAVELGMLEPVLALVEKTLEPHKLCGYLFELASAFTSFYESSPVLRAEDAATRASRLLLCRITKNVLALGLGLLGMAAPERM